MGEAVWVQVTHVARSRPFLLFMILVLSGFLCLHYVTPSAEVSVFIADIPVNDVRAKKQTTSSTKGLYRDVLQITDNPSKYIQQNVVSRPIVVVDRKNQNVESRKIQNETPKVVPNLKGYFCTKHLDVSFLKVHKAGSTTLMNIFSRFAINHNLNLVLPQKSDGFGFNYLGYGETVSAEKIVPLPANQTYNILCNHVVYNKEAFRSIMPPDTMYLGIIREPVSHFTSAASYYGFYKHLRQILANKAEPNMVISTFLKNPRAVRVPTYFVYNRMSFDFGIPKSKFHDDTFVEQYIKELDQDYQLIMIMERFQESLVLMRRILCWDTKDILFVPLNAMRNKPDFHLDEYDIQNLRHWNSADFRLYSHFYEVFNSKIIAQGADLQEEVKSFTSIQEDVSMFCTNIDLEQNDSSINLSVAKTKWGNSFVVTISDCELMMQSELPMVRRLIDDAWVKYNNSLTP